MPQRLPRFYAAMQRLEDDRKLARIAVEASDGDEPVDARTVQRAGSTAAGDSRRLRGIPALSRGVAGAINGTNPLAALLAKDSRRRR